MIRDLLTLCRTFHDQQHSHKLCDPEPYAVLSSRRGALPELEHPDMLSAQSVLMPAEGVGAHRQACAVCKSMQLLLGLLSTTGPCTGSRLRHSSSNTQAFHHGMCLRALSR